MTNQLTVFLKGDLSNEQGFINEDCLPDFLYQYRDCPDLQVKDNWNSLYLKMVNGEIVEYCTAEIKETFQNTLQKIRQLDNVGSWKPLKKFGFLYDILGPESMTIFSTNVEIAKKDMFNWIIFEPKNISQIA